MAEPISPINAELKLAQILGDDFLVQAPQPGAGITPAAEPGGKVEFAGNPFDDVLAKAIEALDGVSKSEIYANQMIDKYLLGKVELQEVMVAQAKMSLVVQLAVTTINTVVNTFKELTQMQI